MNINSKFSYVIVTIGVYKRTIHVCELVIPSRVRPHAPLIQKNTKVRI
jgi:hypothetical protein